MDKGICCDIKEGKLPCCAYMHGQDIRYDALRLDKDTMCIVGFYDIEETLESREGMATYKYVLPFIIVKKTNE
ncbi:MAG: hypothetical protein Q8O09_03955 [Bacillota bacterium]|nr:hypothetical protein [Bacillota bacterium]